MIHSREAVIEGCNHILQVVATQLMEILDGVPAGREDAPVKVHNGDSLVDGHSCIIEAGIPAVEEVQASEPHTAVQLSEIIEVSLSTETADASATFNSGTYSTGADSMQATPLDVMVLSNLQI